MQFSEYLEAYKDLRAYMIKKHGKIQGNALFLAESVKKPIDLSYKYNVLKDVDDAEFGRFIMIETAMSKRVGEQESIKLLAFNVLRPKEDIVFDNTDSEKEKKHSDMVLEEDYIDVINACNAYVLNRDYYINTRYKGVYYRVPDEKEDNDEEEDADDSVDKEIETKMIGVSERLSTDFYWHGIIDFLSGERFLDHERVLMKKMRDISPHMAYIRLKQIERKLEEDARRIKSQLKNR